ncbi:hypothetical protein RFM23_21325 [Mesorhizobium abyssinicae]|uniref:Uncharacterized protein n=1 Tax=Mesorhizobium abyssinicae TaxID=1209958 RepID=A0ABU5AS95_9HYPH|nr:hypothetical protein [Mesorhizobium abyssinicae]MDX8540164.1 hypothetical protein [Mesorhizobium abyssinicae]
MELNYDFEFQSIFPKAVWLVPECKRLLDEVGIAHNMKGNYVTAFVDPATVVALWREPAEFRATLIKAGWSTLPYEGEAAPDKAQFLIPKLLEIHAKVESRAYDAQATKYAVFALFRFTHQLTMGEVLGADGRPTCSPLTQQRMKDARPTSAFDVKKAVTAMVSDLENRAGAEPAAPPAPVKSAAPGPSLLGRVARVFGRRQT